MCTFQTVLKKYKGARTIKKPIRIILMRKSWTFRNFTPSVSDFKTLSYRLLKNLVLGTKISNFSNFFFWRFQFWFFFFNDKILFGLLTSSLSNFINNEAHLLVKVFTMSSWSADVITILSSAPSDTLWSWN